jgi:UDP-GlcNAc:undecaprenyl-phosphate GlcNAc-1-phosphate transferase
MELLLSPVIALLVALMISVSVVPLMMRLAPRIGMIDLPDPRKVHATPIPRVGGIGIALGTISALLLMAPWDTFLAAFVAGAAVLCFFGGWDDMKEIGHYPKFAGQIIAAALIIWVGDVWIADFPFLAEPLPGWIGKPFTLVTIIGVINAINHSDGLDGLAGGETLLGLAAMSILAYLGGSQTFLFYTAAVSGGVLGFLRFNTHPAKVFMGDLGSQFIGFGLVVLAIQLTQQAIPGLSKTIALLLVGLPVADILMVLYLRVSGGMNWFRATRNHIHHRLLELDFSHHEAVLIIYSTQVLIVAGALAMAYEVEALVVAYYLAISGALFMALRVAHRRGWRFRPGKALTQQRRFVSGQFERLQRVPLLFVKITVPLFLLFAALTLDLHAGLDSVTPIAAIPACLMFCALIFGLKRSATLYRLSMFCAVAVLGYCNYALFPVVEADAALGLGPNSMFSMAYMAALAVMIAWEGFVKKSEFSATTMDFLIMVLLVAATVLAHEMAGATAFWTVIVEMTVLFYACELVITMGAIRWNYALSVSAVASMAILMVKPLVA